MYLFCSYFVKFAERNETRSLNVDRTTKFGEYTKRLVMYGSKLAVNFKWALWQNYLRHVSRDVSTCDVHMYKIR